MIAATLLVFTTFFIGQNVAQNAPASIIVNPPKYTSAVVGQTVRMTCAAYGVPTPSIVWTRSNGDVAAKLSDSNSGYKKYEQTTTVNGVAFRVSVLELCGVSLSETDEYICTGDNDVAGDGIASSEARFYLSVADSGSEPPSVVVRPPAEGTVDFGSTIEAVCVAYGNPMPTIQWSKQGCADISCSINAQIFTEVVMYGDISYRKSTLQLCSVDESNSGTYVCTAENGIPGDGVTPKTFSWQLKVNPKPAVPTTSNNIIPTTSCPQLQATSTTSTSRTVNGTEAARPITDDDFANEQIYQIIVGAETVAIVILILGLVITIVLIFKFRSKNAAERAPQPMVYSQTFSTGAKNRNYDVDDTARDRDDDNEPLADSVDVSYANLVKKMEDDD